MFEEHPTTFINQVAHYRRSKNLTQAQLARLVQVSRQTISTIEKRQAIPSVQIAVRIARVLETSVENLFTQEYDLEENPDSELHAFLRSQGLGHLIIQN